MRSSAGSTVLGISLVAGLAAACGGSTPPPRLAAEPSPVRSIEAESESPPVAEPVREADVPLAARWRAPFAVSSSGRTAAREPRAVAIVGADPAIARALVDIRAAAATEVVDSLSASDRDRVDGSGDEVAVPQERTSARPAADVDRRDEDVAASETLRSPPEPRYHLVRRGDTLWGIARRYNVSPEQIREANDIAGDRVRIGQSLVIPLSPDDQ